METVRATFSKTGRLKYISHLDIMRCVSRAFGRCGLPIWYTQGFNPHPYLTFALPLPLGIDSECESFDFRLMEPVDYDIACEKLNACLPEELRVQRVTPLVMSAEAICWADYRLCFFDPKLEELFAALRDFLAQETITVTKKTKKGMREVDLKEMLTVLSFTLREDCCELDLRLPAGGTLNISPLLLTGAFAEKLGAEPYWIKMERTAILDKDFCNFL